MKRIVQLCVFLTLISVNKSRSQEKDLYYLFPEFSRLYYSGDFIAAEECMHPILNPENNSPIDWIIGAYNNIGLVKMRLGLYSEALELYNKSENLTLGNKNNNLFMIDIYNNKSRIYTFYRSFSTAIEYLETVIRIYEDLDSKDNSLLSKLSTGYLNLGINHYESGNYSVALENLNKSLHLKEKYNLPEIELTYLNLAKTYARIGNLEKSDIFFAKSITIMKNKFGENYFRIAEIYFDYGIFLRTISKFNESIKINQKALSICINHYGDKHPYVSLSLRNIGDYYLYVNNFDSALYYYQKSIISIVNNFSEIDINKNPYLDSVILNVELFKTLRKKAEALKLSACEKTDHNIKISNLEISLETIDLALQLIDRMRNEYLTEESRMYLAENEKETYLAALHIAAALYKQTGEKHYISRMYDITAKAKAAVLRNEITENELLVASGIPDSLYNRKTELSTNIAAYNNLILRETQETNPDSNKLSLWKDDLFNMNRELEKINEEITAIFPELSILLERTVPLTVHEIQEQLGKDETIVDYILSNRYTDGKRTLYSFIITKDNIGFTNTSLDTLFIENAQVIKDHGNSAYREGEYRDYTGALNFMYKNLIMPFENTFTGNKLIIIPDEEIAWLPFEAFQKELPSPDKSDYEQLPFLIREYIISYGYSSSLLFGKSPKRTGGIKVMAFSPDYGNTEIEAGVAGDLPGAEKEIKSILKRSRGKHFAGSLATETNFRNSIRQPAIFHLSMHSVTDTITSKYSWLAFDSKDDTNEDGRLYNYEISLLRITSPMVVLSSCNSGSGTLYHGEGLMSMARSFILAGASSVVRTSWEVNDEKSAEIIISFYENLSRGMSKNAALRKAKLDFISNSTPTYSDPYYWAAYEVLGNNEPVSHRKTLIIIAFSGFIVIALLIVVYLRRRRISSDRSL